MATTAVPEIAYRFLADNADALRKNNETKKSLKEINDVKLVDIDLSVSKLANSIKGLLPTVSAAAFAGFAYSAVQAADAVGDAADRAQLAVGEFGRLQYIAAQTDVNFEELTRGLKQYRIGVDEAQQGQGNLRLGLERLNLSVADLRDLSIEEQLALIADRFRAVSDPVTRAGIAQDLFNKSGQAMIPLLLRGGDGLRTLAQEAERLGLVFDERAVAGADRFTKALDRLSTRAKVVASGALGTLFADVFGTGDELADTQARLERLVSVRDSLLKHPGPGAAVLIAPTLTAIELLTNRLEALQQQAQQTQFQYGQGSDLPFDQWQRDMAVGEFTPTVQKLYEEDEVIRDIRKRREQEAADAARAQIEMQADLDREVASSQIDNARLITEETRKELDRRHALEDQAREETRGREKELQDTLTAFRRDGANAAVSLLTAYGGRYKKFAQAILVIEKAHAIARTIVSTKAAAAAALEYYGPTPWGYAAAAAAIAYGVAQVAAIASTVIGGGSSAAGSPHNPVFVDTSAQTPDDGGSLGTPAPAEQRVLQLIVNGNIYSGRETVDYLIQQLSQRINEYDTVIINPASRQARELVPEPTT